MSYQNLPFSTAKNTTKATLVMHYSGLGGPMHAFTSQRGPVELFEHGLYFALYKAGFTQADMVSVFQNFPGFDKETVSHIGKELGKKLGLKGSGLELVGFPFDTHNPYELMDKANIIVPKMRELPEGTVRDIGSISDEIMHKAKQPNNIVPTYLDQTIHNLTYLRAFHTADYLKSLDTLVNGGFLVHIGGTHDTDIGPVAAVGTYLNRMGLKAGLVSFDAHGDYNNVRISPSGKLHGMHNAIHTANGWMYFKENYFARLGHKKGDGSIFRKVNPKNLLHVGGCALDPLEIIAMKEDGVNVLAMPAIEKVKANGKLAEVFEQQYNLAMQDVDAVIVSIDFDVLHPQSITPNRRLAVTMQEGNLWPDDLKTMLRVIGQGEKPVVALLVSELNPTAGPDTKGYSFSLANDIIYDFLLANRGPIN